MKAGRAPELHLQLASGEHFVGCQAYGRYATCRSGFLHTAGKPAADLPEDPFDHHLGVERISRAPRAYEALCVVGLDLDPQARAYDPLCCQLLRQLGGYRASCESRDVGALCGRVDTGHRCHFPRWVGCLKRPVVQPASKSVNPPCCLAEALEHCLLRNLSELTKRSDA
jgi:hypothetical protein